MTRASKGKSKPKQSFAKGVGRVVKIAENVQKQMGDFRKEWAEKFNNLHDRFERIVPAIAQQFAQLQMNSQVNSQCIDAIDLQQQSMMKMDERIYGKFEIIDALFQKLGVDADDLDYELLKRQASDTYTTTAKECVQIAQEERAAAIKAKEEAQKKAQEEALAAEQAKKEAEAAESALQQANEEDRIVGDPGGPGTDIPAGAEVFGG